MRTLVLIYINRHFKLLVHYYDVHFSVTYEYSHTVTLLRMCEALSTCCCSAMADTRLQLLFEFQNSRRRVVTTKSRVCEALEQELQRFGFTSARVRYSGDCGSSNSYLLQRWSETWSNYIDVEEDDDLEDKDRVTVVPMTTFSADSEVPTRVRMYTRLAVCAYGTRGHFHFPPLKGEGGVLGTHLPSPGVYAYDL